MPNLKVPFPQPRRRSIFYNYALSGIPKVEITTRRFNSRYGSLEVAAPKLTTSLMKNVLAGLKSSRELALASKSTQQILDIIGRNIQLWSDPKFFYRRKAEELIPITMGFSPEMTRVILEDMVSGFRRDLDKLRPRESDIEQIVCVAPSIPGPQALTIIIGLLNKCAVFCKSSAEDVFSALYAQSYQDIDKGVAECIATVPWDGGKPEYREVEDSFYGERGKRDAIVIFGKSSTEEIIRRKTKPGAKTISFTRGISLGIIGKEMLSRDETNELASIAAKAVCMYDQRDCFSPQLYYVEEGGEISPAEFAGVLAQKMQDLEHEVPRGELSLDASATFTELMKTYELLSLTGDLKLYQIVSSGSPTGAVIYKEDQRFEPSCSYRVVRVKPVNNIYDLPSLLQSLSDSLHTIGIALADERRDQFERALEVFGARVASIDEMYRPTIADYDFLN